MPVDRSRRMWTVGILQGAAFRPLADAPSFRGENEAAAWVRRQLATNRIRFSPGRDLLTWRAPDHRSEPVTSAIA